MAKRQESSSQKGKRQLSTTELPRKTLEECIEVIKPIHEIYAGHSATWDELASALEIGTKSNKLKYLIWGAQAYQLIYRDNSKLALSETGRKLVAPNHPEERSEALVKAVTIPTVLSKFYSDYDGKLVPEDEYLDNVLESRYDVPRDRLSDAKRIILDNAKFANILMEHENGNKTIRLAGIPEEKEVLGGDDLIAPESEGIGDLSDLEDQIPPVESDGEICFYITPIGEENSEFRRHADMMLRHLIKPAFDEFGITVVRSDNIGKSGLISQQVFEYIISSKFCVADMSFGNPNAFYELGVRHMTKLPTIQIIRKGDKIPFDVAQGRTITVDISDIYTLMDKIQSAKNELIEHIRNFKNPDNKGDVEENPISIYLPGLEVKFPSKK